MHFGKNNLLRNYDIMDGSELINLEKMRLKEILVLLFILMVKQVNRFGRQCLELAEYLD